VSPAWSASTIAACAATRARQAVTLAARALLALAACLPLLLPAPAHAHKPSDSYLAISVDGSTISGQWDIALRDLDHAIGLDADGDAQITWGELRARHADIAAYALARLAVNADGAACTLRPGEQLVDEHTDGAYTVLRFAVDCPALRAPPAALRVDYRLFADLDPQHRGLLRLDAAGSSRTAIFSPQAAQQDFELQAASRAGQFGAYFVEGVWHIWIGFDHILFLVSLLLPAVLVWQQRRWQPAERFGQAFFDVLKIVTSFTVAHSITLSLATLGVVSLPSRVVESAIAASVVLAALNNVWPLVHGRRWVVAFVFGLIHGFGFASVLADLGLPSGTLVLALVGFNLGVEAGQLAIVAVFLPLAYALRRTALYRRGVFFGGSLLIAALAGVWLAERAFNLQLLTL
jgi:HupE / UreJ protein